MAGGHLGLRAEAVDRAQRLDRYRELRGHLRQRFAVVHPVGLPGHERLVAEVELRREELGLVDRQQQRVLVGARDDRPVEVRIEELELLERHLRQLGGALDVHSLRRVDDGEIRRIGNVVEDDPVLRGVADEILHRLQLRQVVAGFVGHLEARVIERQPLLLVVRDRLGDVALAPVVGGERQLPVVEIAVQLGEIGRARLRCPRSRRGANRTRKSASARSGCRSTG